MTEQLECLKCGKCCKYVVLVFPMGIADKEYARDWLGYHGIKIYQENETSIMALQVPAICKFLNENGTCSIYTDPSRPKICADFPVGKDPICPQNLKKDKMTDKTMLENKNEKKND